jgi:CubicO group peptidase (beta-lactamase class C family)
VTTLVADEPFDTSTHNDLKLMQGFPPPPDKRVDRSNGLWVPPFNRWSYQNARQIWPTAPVRRSLKAVDLPRRPEASMEQIQVAREDGTIADFGTFLRQTFTDSFVVISAGEIIYEKYLNGMTADQPHIMFSCTKCFIGLFALMAVDEGLVSEDTPIIEIIPELDNGGGYARATFGQVLDMTTSIRFSEYYADPDAEIHDYVAVLGAGVKAGGGQVSSDLYAYARTLKADPAQPHGAVFEYQTPDADVLNWAVSRLLGASYVKTLEDRIWSRIGTDGEAYILLDPAGIIFAGGGLSASANDLARFAAMVLDNGWFNGKEVVAKRIIDRIADGGSTKAFLAGTSAEKDMANGHWSFRAQWWVRNAPGHEAIMAIGVNGQWIYVDRDRDIAIVKQSSQPEADSWYFHEYTMNAFDAVIRRFGKDTGSR